MLVFALGDLLCRESLVLRLQLLAINLGGDKLGHVTQHLGLQGAIVFLAHRLAQRRIGELPLTLLKSTEGRLAQCREVVEQVPIREREAEIRPHRQSLPNGMPLALSSRKVASWPSS